MRKPLLSIAVVLASVASAAPRKKPTLQLAAPIITGKVNAKLVTATVKRGHARLLDCYAKQAPVEAGSANASFTIGSDGKVTNVVVTITALPAAVESCLAGVLGKLQFGKRKGDPVEVSYALTFQPPPVDQPRAVGSYPSITGTGDMSTGSVVDVGGKPVVVGNSGWGPRTGMTARTGPAPQVSIGQLTAQGNLDQAIVRRYVKRNIQRLVLCYEQELATRKTLEGTSTAVFAIGADGKVSGLTVSGLDAKVDGCIAGVIGAIEFPPPKGGGTVSVRTPLTFQPGKP